MVMRKLQPKEYGIFINGTPFFSCVLESTVDVLVAEARARFGDETKVEVFVHTTDPYVSVSSDSFGDSDGQ